MKKIKNLILLLSVSLASFSFAFAQDGTLDCGTVNGKKVCVFCPSNGGPCKILRPFVSLQ